MHIPLKRYLALLVTYLQPQWRGALLMAVLLLTNIGLQLLNPWILKYFIDTAIAGGASLSLGIVGLSFIGIALANQAVSIGTAYLSTNVAWTATNRLRSDLVAHCLTLDMSFHKTRTSGELIERIDGDVDVLSNFFSQFVVSLFGSMILLIAMLVLFFTIDWRVGVTMTAFTVIALLILMYLRRRAIPFWKARRQKSAEFFGFLSERLVGTQDIGANGATAYIMRRFYLLRRDWLPVHMKAGLASARMGITSLFLFVVGSALAISLGTYLWSIGVVTVGTIYLLFSYTDRLSQPIDQIQQQLQDLQQAEACIQRIEEFLSARSALYDGAQASLPEGPLAVAFRTVSFGYVAENAVISDLTFEIQPGKILGVLGRTGSGKTTLSRLLFRMYDPQRGEVCIGGVPVRTVSLRDLRRHVGVVTQDVQLFHATVRNNLTFFNRSIPDAEIVAVLDKLGLVKWYHALPHGLDTELGPNGEGLSAGEAQLLAFARVFLANPGLVILDEASSRLDPVTQHLIEHALERLFVNRPLS